MKVIILVLGCLSVVGCGGGDGASLGGSISDSGSAVFQNFSASSVVPNVCRNFAVPTDSFACSSAGGT